MQTELFSDLPAPPALTSLQQHHDELVDLLSRLLWEIVQACTETTPAEVHDEQDHR
jgi:hypothetical protein